MCFDLLCLKHSSSCGHHQYVLFPLKQLRDDVKQCRSPECGRLRLGFGLAHIYLFLTDDLPEVETRLWWLCLFLEILLPRLSAGVWIVSSHLNPSRSWWKVWYPPPVMLNSLSGCLMSQSDALSVFCSEMSCEISDNLPNNKQITTEY